MSNYFSEPAEKFVPSYQISGKPFALQVSAVTGGGGTEVVFPQVTRWIRISHTNANAIELGFSSNGVAGTVTNNYITIPAVSKADEATTGILELRCKSIFLRSASGTKTVSVIAGLTDISALSIPLSGSNGIG